MHKHEEEAEHNLEHGHGHGTGHSHAPADFSRAFAIGIALNFGFVVAEAIFGIRSNSLSLLADAGHNLGDVLGLLLAWGASVAAKKQRTEKHTFGFRRTTVLAAVFNGIVLLIGIGGITWEAIRRLLDPQASAGMTIIVVCAIGIFVNGATAIMFMSGRKTDINLRGAFLHMAADACISLGVVGAGIAIKMTGFLWIDPVTSLIIAALLAYSAWDLLRDSFNLAVDGVPEGVDLKAISEYLAALPSIEAVHHLHVWALSTTEIALTAHLIKGDDKLDDELLGKIEHDLHEKFGIEHPTIQLEHTRRFQKEGR